MNDQCKHCMVRGDYEACIKEPCFNRQNWFAQKQAARIAELEANNARLRDFARRVKDNLCVAGVVGDASVYVPDEGDFSYYGQLAGDLLSETPADSLAAVRREAMEKARDQMINVVENFWNLVDDSGPEDMVRAMRETKFYE